MLILVSSPDFSSGSNNNNNEPSKKEQQRCQSSENDNNNLICTLKHCHKQFKSKYELERHTKKSHKAETKYFCQFCDK